VGDIRVSAEFDSAWLAPSGVLGDRYEITRALGRGGAAIVLLARDRRYDREVAIKVLKPELAGLVATERFLQEVRITASLQHPHILPLLDSGEARGLPYYVSPYIAGGSLRDRLTQERQLPLGEALDIAADVASALTYAHERGILHRDIKPENVLIAGSDAIVADFGLAQALARAGGDRLTSSGIVVGTPAYVSPEQALGDRTLGPATDVYSLGCVIYEMIAGVAPFVGPTPESVIAQRFRGPPRPLRHYRLTVSRDAERAVSRALLTTPADRFASPNDFATALGVARKPTPPRASHPVGGYSRVRARTLSVAGCAAGILVLGALVFARFNRLPSAATSIDRGALALSVGDVDRAVSSYRRAVQADPRNAVAQLGLAQALLLEASDTTAEWRSAIRLAAAARGTLSAANRSRAEAFGALLDQQYGQACDLFRRLRVDDPRDIAAAIGLARCIKADSVVVADPSSPSGWRFRSSYDEAERTYQSVLDAYPTARELHQAIFPQLVRLIRPEWGRFRPGVGVNDHAVQFGGWPALERDSLGERVTFVPYLLPELALAAPATEALRKTGDAIEHERQQLRTVARSWTREFPSDPSAHESLSRALELLGNIEPTRPDEPSALAEIRAARQLSADTHRRLAFARDEVRLLVKTFDISHATALADSTLTLVHPSGGGDREVLANLALLTGRVQQAVSLIRRTADSTTFQLPSGEIYRPVPDLAAAARSFFVFASAGAPIDSVRASLKTFDQLLESRVPPGRRDSIRSGMVGRALGVASPVLGPQIVAKLPSSTTALVSLWQPLARGDTLEVRLKLDSLERLRSARYPGALHIDEAYQESLLRLAIADTGKAVRQLDASLGALPTSATSLLTEMPEAAALGRAMLLRSVIAERLGDRATAERWRRAVGVLWRNADPELRPH
jgi:tetratricopeptide (TPR) repeat protein